MRYLPAYEWFIRAIKLFSGVFVELGDEHELINQKVRVFWVFMSFSGELFRFG